jgi:subtilisin family serine protease
VKNRFLKFLSTLLGVIITISCMIISSSSAKSDYNPNKSVNVKRILVKYKTNVKNAAEKVQKKKNNKKVKEFKKTRNDNVYIIDIESENFNELLLDSDIELIEEDAIVQILDRDMYEEEIEEHPEHERSCCISFDGSHAVCNGDCDCETDCNCGLCVKDNFGEDDTDYTDEPNNTEIIESPKEPLEPEPEEMEIETLETGTAGKQNIYGDKVPWNITRIKADRLHDMGITGAGVKVAVFDTGIDLDNPDLNVAGGISFVDGVTSYDDDNGHGTAMAGILAASLNGSGLVGVAPSIELYSVKVLDSYGMGRYSSVLQAIDWAIENDIDIITMSFGGSQYSQILSEAIKKASDKNIMIFAAAGNTGSNGIYYPAAFPHVVCVGSTDSNNTVAAFSNRGEQMNLVAPGVAVETLGMNNSNTYVDGTSASVQHAAGVAALLLGANKNITNGHIMFLLYYNAYVLGDIEIYGNGLVDAKKAYENLCTGKYYIPIIDENGEERIIYGQVGIGEDGIVFAQAACSKCSCSDCSKGSSFYNYAEHSSGGHRRVYYCGSSSCKSKHTYTCVYASNEFDKFTNCCSCQGSHLYDNTCDSTCNRCGAQRTISHTYSNNCDTTCNVCGYTRTISHTYSNNCDTTCNVCGYTRSISHTYSNNCDSTCNVCSASRTPPHASIKWDSSHSSTHYNDPAGSGHIRWGRCSSCSILLTFVFESDSSCCSCGYHSWSSSLSKVHKGSYDEYYKYCTKSGCSAKSLYGTYTCSCHTCSYTTKVYGSHTSTGHDVYKKCSCGSQSYQGYKEANPNCISCTTPPTVIIKGPKAGAILCELDTSVKPQIDVQDNENDTLTCKYYIDSETTPRGTETVTGTSSTKTVTFATGVNAASLSEGSHTLKVEVKDSIAPVGTKTITFKVDKSAPSIATPTISSSANSITVTVSATDSGAGLDQYPYRFTIGNETTGWLSSNIYTSSATLMPNTQYSVKVEVRDATTAKHTAQYSTNVYTRAAVPDITVSNCTQTTFDCTISDNNPSNTYYQIVVGNKYVSQSGSLVDSATWITLTNKKITVTGLTANTSYTVKAKAKNASGVDTGYSSSKTATTLQLPPATPAGLSKHTATQTSITLVWSLVNGADSYDIERIDPQSGSQIFTGVTTSPFTDVNLAVNKSYQYRIRAKNTGGSSSWSEIINISTLPYPPGKPTGLSAQLSPGTILLSWNGLSDATSYDVFVNGTFVENVTDPLFEHNNLMPDTQYEYQVPAVKVT